ncbi:MAG: mechanosensitive ion channel domain-containing protein [Candidatus Neomarinimicrobiota bacterium]
MDEPAVTPENIQRIEDILQHMGSEYLWVAVGLAAAFFSKELIMNFVQGMMVFIGTNIQNDDIIYISGRQARVVRKGLKSTVFYMSDRKTKMLVPNEQLKHLTIERKLPINGCPYLPKGGDPEFDPDSVLEIDK